MSSKKITCKGCGKLKPVEEFHRNRCRNCRVLYMRVYHRKRRREDPEYAKEYANRLRKLEKLIKSDSAKGRAIRKRYLRKRRHLRKVWTMAKYYHPKRKRCSVRGCKKKAERHHPDYSKPKEIIWLCRKHHKELHTNAAEDFYRQIESRRFSKV